LVKARRLLAVGCPKVNLLIEPDNAAVAGFYARLGYRQEELLFMEKSLIPEPENILIPNVPGYPSPPPAPADHGWRDIRPDLFAEPYVFAEGEPPPGVSPFAVIREDEGVTLILTRTDADRVGLAYDYVAARITLRVNSALCGPPKASGFCRAASDSGISAAASSNTRPASTHAVTGRRTHKSPCIGILRSR